MLRRSAKKSQGPESEGFVCVHMYVHVQPNTT
jgi:hypothetical protein